MPEILTLREEVGRLSRLLDDPQPALSTWQASLLMAWTAFGEEAWGAQKKPQPASAEEAWEVLDGRNIRSAWWSTGDFGIPVRLRYDHGSFAVIGWEPAGAWIPIMVDACAGADHVAFRRPLRRKAT